jgi:glycine/D-amino acid oxidase-like deaminating enzyme
MRNSSPWIEQLRKDRKIQNLTKDIESDVVVIGGGISGVVTAYMTLTLTNRNVVLLEARKLAYGATGHNAGQLVAAFERPIRELVKDFGKKKVIEALKGLEIEAWVLLESIIKEANLTLPYSTFLGYGGCLTVEQLIEELDSILFHKENDLPYHDSFIAKEQKLLEIIPAKYHGLCIEIPQEDIARVLSVTHNNYIAAVAEPAKMGCMNSALFTEQLAEYCLEKFKDRFTIYEHTKVDRVVLHTGRGILHANGFSIAAHEIVLCTNGFEHFSIENTTGVDIDTKFHHDIVGVVGYMSSFYDSSPIPYARWYLMDSINAPESETGEPYFYVTRRPFETPPPYKGLVCVGGPEVTLVERSLYDPETLIDEVIQQELLSFTAKNIVGAENFKHSTFWHGLMGYTPSGVRLIGVEPCNEVLLYNLGCNGIGILPSIYGARKIARHLNGEKLEKTIFDPQDVRCILSVENK